jgi:hypothetical protein
MRMRDACDAYACDAWTPVCGRAARARFSHQCPCAAGLCLWMGPGREGDANARLSSARPCVWQYDVSRAADRVDGTGLAAQIPWGEPCGMDGTMGPVSGGVPVDVQGKPARRNLPCGRVGARECVEPCLRSLPARPMAIPSANVVQPMRTCSYRKRPVPLSADALLQPCTDSTAPLLERGAEDALLADPCQSDAASFRVIPQAPPRRLRMQSTSRLAIATVVHQPRSTARFLAADQVDNATDVLPCAVILRIMRTALQPPSGRPALDHGMCFRAAQRRSRCDTSVGLGQKSTSYWCTASGRRNNSPPSRRVASSCNQAPCPRPTRSAQSSRPVREEAQTRHPGPRMRDVDMLARTMQPLC